MAEAINTKGVAYIEVSGETRGRFDYWNFESRKIYGYNSFSNAVYVKHLTKFYLITCNHSVSMSNQIPASEKIYGHFLFDNEKIQINITENFKLLMPEFDLAIIEITHSINPRIKSKFSDNAINLSDEIMLDFNLEFTESKVFQIAKYFESTPDCTIINAIKNSSLEYIATVDHTISKTLRKQFPVFKLHDSLNEIKTGQSGSGMFYDNKLVGINIEKDIKDNFVYTVPIYFAYVPIIYGIRSYKTKYLFDILYKESFSQIRSNEETYKAIKINNDIKYKLAHDDKKTFVFTPYHYITHINGQQINESFKLFDPNIKTLVTIPTYCIINSYKNNAINHFNISGFLFNPESKTFGEFNCDILPFNLHDKIQIKLFSNPNVIIHKGMVFCELCDDLIDFIFTRERTKKNILDLFFAEFREIITKSLFINSKKNKYVLCDILSGPRYYDTKSSLQKLSIYDYRLGTDLGFVSYPIAIIDQKTNKFKVFVNSKEFDL